MFYYLDNLKKEAREQNAGNINEFILARAGSSADSVEESALRNSARAAKLAVSNPAYSFQKNKVVPKKINSHLTRFDCLSCDICIPVCPNAANFSFTTGKTEEALFDYKIQNGRLQKVSAGRFILQKETQIGNIAEFCNECGNCDTFCPELGGPFKQKSRFFLYESTWNNSLVPDGFYFSEPNKMRARFSGNEYELFWNQNEKHFEWSAANWKLIIDESGAAEVQGEEGAYINGTLFYTAKVIFNAIRRAPKRYPNLLLLAVNNEDLLT